MMYKELKYRYMGPNAENHKKRLGITLLQIVAAVSLFISSGIPDTNAEFALNFKPLTSGVTYQSWGDDDENGHFSCNEMSFQSNRNCKYDETDYAHDDNTPMYQRIFRSTTPGATNGKYYWHVIIGDYYDQGNNPTNTQGFYLEYIIEASSGNRFDDHIGTAASASTTWVSGNTGENIGGLEVYDSGTNGTYTSSGYANPKRVIMRQIMEDGETRSTFLKDSFENKPFISQTVVDYKVTDPSTNVDNEFTLDMRMIDYDTYDNTGVIMNNITNLSGGNEAANQGDYDTTDATYTPHMFNQEDAVVTAGKFTWTTGSGNLGAKGTYTYYNEDDTVNASGFQPHDKNYSQFCDPSYNVNWSGRGACKNPNGGGEGWGKFGWD